MKTVYSIDGTFEKMLLDVHRFLDIILRLFQFGLETDFGFFIGIFSDRNIFWMSIRMESQQESTFIHLIRSGILLLVLIAVPGTAVCWNLIPKDLFHDSATRSMSRHVSDETEADEAKDVEANGDEDDFAPLDYDGSGGTTSFEELNNVGFASPPVLEMPDFDFPKTASHQETVRTMSYHETAAIAETRIPSEFDVAPAVWAAEAPRFADSAETSLFQDLPAATGAAEPQRGFSELEEELKSLGAKYYRLEKWGSRGEMFRFSCYVSPSETVQYRKHFQAIDSDELRVMERVVREIRHWKEMR